MKGDGWDGGDRYQVRIRGEINSYPDPSLPPKGGKEFSEVQHGVI